MDQGRRAASNDLVLEEVADHIDLFADPDLEIARLEPGTARDIVVPVQLGDGATARRFRLTVRLRFDRAD